MPKWVIGLLAASVGLVAMSMASVPLWIAYRFFGVRGGIGAYLAGALAFAIVIVAIVATVWAQTGIQRWAQALTSRRYQVANAKALARLRADPAHSHWVDLAVRYGYVNDGQIAHWERRYRQLLADPRRKHRAAACLQGQFPSDIEIDYEDDPDALRTCVHLQPVERALRRGGYGCHAFAHLPAIYADAAIDFESTRTQFALPASVSYVISLPQPHDWEERQLVCAICGSWISESGTREFPPP